MSNYVMWLDFRLSGGDRDTYRNLRDLSERSCRKNLQGSWDPLVIQGDYHDLSFQQGVSEMYKNMFAFLRGHYESGDNVLFLDPDVAVVRPTEIFDRFLDLMLFWKTDPDRRGPFDPYLNAGVVYVPASMNHYLWAIVDEKAHRMAAWDDSQEIFNEMFYAQDPVPELHPELNWSPNVSSIIDGRDARVVHFNSTRGPLKALAHMRDAVLEAS